MMMDTLRKSFAVLALALLLSPAAHADEAQDQQVEIGIQAYDDGDYERAKSILLPLAEDGDPKAMNMIGLMTKFGNGFPEGLEIACDWYEKSANAGYPSAMYNLSICYNQGMGRNKDHQMMLHWRTLAATHGYIPAMINLAALDPDEGAEYRRWMLLAQDHNSAYAKVSLWLQGYKTDSKMTFTDFVCVSWRILIMNGKFRDCD